MMRTNKQTNKQTPLKTSTSLRYATPVSNKSNSWARWGARRAASVYFLVPGHSTCPRLRSKLPRTL